MCILPWKVCTQTALSEFRFGPYFVEPVVAGLDPITDKPYIATMDLIGCPMETQDFVVGGTCTEQLYGMCESLWNPDMVRSSDYSIVFGLVRLLCITIQVRLL